MNAAAVLSNIKDIRHELLSMWAVPILNDIRVMIFHGILKTTFFGDEHRESYLLFLDGLTDRASIKPLKALQHLGREIETIEQGSDHNKQALIDNLAQKYIQDFGARTPDELKLENARLSDDTKSIIDLSHKAKSQSIEQHVADRSQATKHLGLFKRIALNYVAAQARKAIDWRERFRFNRAQVFGIARDAYLAIGSHFVRENILLKQEDIFYLTEQEIDEIVDGHAWSYAPAQLVSERKKQYKAYESNELSTAMSGTGVVAPLHLEAVQKPTADSNVLAGFGVAPGILTAPVIIARTFDVNLDVRGKILVTRHIDPGWTLLFTQAAAVITERGNALSHAAIVAREIGIPAIVAVPHATTILKDGDILHINGITGEIHHERA